MTILWLDRPILLIALDKVAKLFRGFLRAIRTSQLSNMLHKKSILWNLFCHVVKNVKRKVFFRMAWAVAGTELLMTFNLLILPTFRFSTGSIQWRKTDEFWVKNSTVAALLDRFHEAFQSRKCLAAEILRRSTSKKTCTIEIDQVPILQRLVKLVNLPLILVGLTPNKFAHLYLASK